MLTKSFRKLRFLFLTLISIAFVCFAILNREFIHISLFPLPYTADMPIFIFAVICFALGIIGGGIFFSSKLSQSKSLLKHQHIRIAALQNELNGLRMEKNIAVTPHTLRGLPPHQGDAATSAA